MKATDEFSGFSCGSEFADFSCNNCFKCQKGYDEENGVFNCEIEAEFTRAYFDDGKIDKKFLKYVVNDGRRCSQFNPVEVA